MAGGRDEPRWPGGGAVQVGAIRDTWIMAVLLGRWGWWGDLPVVWWQMELELK